MNLLTVYRTPIFYYVSLLFLLTILSKVYGGSMPLVKFNMEVSLDSENKRPDVLAVKLTNTSPTPISVYRNDLPWEGSHNMLLIAAKVDGGTEVTEGLVYISDPSFESMKLEPGCAMEGKLMLRNHFPNLPEMTRGSNVVIFWTYRLKQTDGSSCGRSGGWVFIPLGSLSQGKSSGNL